MMHMTNQVRKMTVAAGVLGAVLGAVTTSAAVELPAEPDVQIDESQVQHVLHVDQQSAGAEDGGEATPYRTLGAALERAVEALKRGEGVKISVRPGVYREDFEIAAAEGETALRDATLIIEGTDPEQVIISGSDAQAWRPETWQPVEGQPGLYWHEWDRRYEPFPGGWIGYGVVLDGLSARREVLYIDGKPVKPVELELYQWKTYEHKTDPEGNPGRGIAKGEFIYLGMTPRGLSALEPGTFGVIDHPQSPEQLRGRMYLRLPEGVTLSDIQMIEVPRNTGEQHWLDTNWRIDGKRNFVLRGLTFSHGGTFLTAGGVVLDDVQNVLVENCRFVWNAGRGLQYRASEGPIVIRNSVMNHNGQKGLKLHRGRKALIVDSDISHNCWRGYWTGFVGWDSAGSKIGSGSNDVTFRQCTVIGNKTGGLWFDVDLERLLVDRCFVYGNGGIGRPGVEFENGADQGTMRHTVVANTESAGLFYASGGAFHAHDNIIVNNGGSVLNETYCESQIYYRGGVGPTHVHDNIIGAVNKRPLIGYAYGRTKAEDYREALAEANYHDNVYYSNHEDRLFELPGPKVTDFAGWQAYLAEVGAPGERDGNSTFRDIGLASDGESDWADPNSPLVQLATSWGVPVPTDRVTDLLAERRAEAARLAQRLQEPWPLFRNTKNPVFKQIPLAPVANRPLSGKTAPYPRVTEIEPGVVEVHGVPLQIDGGSKAAIALRSAKYPEAGGEPSPEQVELPIDAQVKAMYIVHGASYAHETGPIGWYELVYADDSTHRVEIVVAGRPDTDDPAKYLAAQPTVQDWWHEFTPIENASARPVPLGTTGRHLYHHELVNPNPQKTVKALRMIGSGEKDPTLSVFGVTALLAD